MGMISRIAGIAVCIALAGASYSCTDGLIPETPEKHGVDMDNIVEVGIPFGLGKGITSQVVTRATDQSGKDSQLSGIMVFVYANNGGEPANDKLISFQFFESPNESLEGSTGGWIPDPDDKTCGMFKMYMPVGDVFIYLIGNATGSFIDFFPSVGDNELQSRQDFLDYVTPKWTGNMYSVDGFLPLFGTVNNDNGACRIAPGKDSQGIITYIGKDGQEHTISQVYGEPETEENSFVLKRLMCKISMEFKSGPGTTFTPKAYKFYHCAEFVPPTTEAWKEVQHLLDTKDTETVPFDAQTPNSFTVYLPENIREYTPATGGKEQLTFTDRDRVVKKDDGTNTGETSVGHAGHYDFEFAPDKSTYVEITGKFEGNNVSADTKYILHLGDFGKDMNEFSLRRDCHYRYTVTVNGVNDIVVEANGENGNPPVEKNPSVEGIVFKGGARLQLDAHYEQVEMHLKKEALDVGVYIYAQTPFGTVNCKYLPASKSLDPDYNNNPSTTDEIKKLVRWIEFRKQSGKGTLATYSQNEMLDVFSALDNAYAGSGGYYTCFIDEYYYTENPVDGSGIFLKDFINAEDRTFSIGSDITYSADGQSAVASSVYVLYQHSIACFYDLENRNVAKYGVECVDEIGDLVGPLLYGTPAGRETSETKDGRGNTIQEIGSNTGAVDWTHNGFLLSDDETALVPGRERLEVQEAHLACLTRNRDFNGDGSIDADELRWYTPARDQMLGLWIGEPALPTKAALYPHSTDNLQRPARGSAYPIFTSTGDGDSRVIYAEEGCSFGDAGSAPNGGYVRAVRNLGSRPSSDSHTTVAQPYYTYNSSERTIEVYLTSNALRAFSSRELAPHHERSLTNRPYRKFQVASKPYTKQDIALCEEHVIGQDERTYEKLQTTDAARAKEDITTIAAEYPGNGEQDISLASWRLPNQRELALMVVAMGTEMDYDMDNGDYHHMDYVCNGFISHRWEYKDNHILHCRTSFSNKDYTPYGYMYNTTEGGRKIQMMYDTGGAGEAGFAGYLCVRDVRE